MRLKYLLVAIMIGLPMLAVAQQEVAPDTIEGPLHLKPEQPISLPQQQESAELEHVYTAEDGVQLPVILQAAAAINPVEFVVPRSRIICLLSVIIGADGTLKNYEVKRSHYHQFDKAAIAAVQHSTYQPGTLNGKPVPVQLFAKVCQCIFLRISGHF